VGVQSGRMDRDSSAPSTARFAGCLRVVPAGPEAGSNAPHSTPLHGVHSTTEGHLGVHLLVLRVGLLWGCVVGELPNLCQNYPTRLSSTLLCLLVEVTSVHGETLHSPIHTHRCASRVFSVRRTPI
jgi:hypothetical protein